MSSYYATPHGPKYGWVDPPADSDIQAMVARLAKRVIRFLKKKGYFKDDVDSTLPEDEAAQDELLPGLQAASVKSRIGLGERKGQRVRRIGSLDLNDIHPELKGPLCATAVGFSLHAATYCAPSERRKLEKLCRYISRPAVSEERLALRPSGDIVLKLKTPYSDGSTHLLFSGVEFIEKLAALVPPPRAHLVRFFGCLAPHSKIRSLRILLRGSPFRTARSSRAPALEAKIVPQKEMLPDPPSSSHPHSDATPSSPFHHSHKMKWAKLLARTFGIDLSHCSQCGGKLKILCAILEKEAIRKILSHLGIPPKPPDIAPARLATQMTFA